MNIEILAKNMSLTEAIENAARESIKKSLKIQEKIINVKVTVEKTNSPKHPFKVTGIIHNNLGDIVLSKEGEDMYKLLNILSDDLARQVRKQKEKHQH